MERAKSIVHLSCEPLVLSNVLREATHLETALRGLVYPDGLVCSGSSGNNLFFSDMIFVIRKRRKGVKVVSKRSSFGFTSQLATALFRIILPGPILRYFTNDHLITEKGRPTYGILTMHRNRMTHKSGFFLRFTLRSLSEVAWHKAQLERGTSHLARHHGIQLS